MYTFLLEIFGFFFPIASAAGIAGAGNSGGRSTDKVPAESAGSFSDSLVTFGEFLMSAVAIFVLFLLLIKTARLFYEIYASRKLVYMRVTLPRADSKLDKERETKKDFKEKMGIMSVFYKSVHKIGDITFKDWVLDSIFDHMKVSLELVYEEGQLSFYVVTYSTVANFIAQQITSNYPDAEVRIIRATDFPNLKPEGYTLRAASLSKVRDDVYPIKAYKYFEDDPLSTFTNNFGTLKRTDRAAFQIVIKPLGASWNKRAKNAANLTSKGTYKGKSKGGIFLQILQGLLSPIYWLVNNLVNNERSSDTNAPGASSGDSYKIFNQAEQEAQKAMGESAGQPGFLASMRLLVSSDTPESAEMGLQTVVGGMNVFTDEYNNKLDNPQYEDVFKFFFVPLRYFAFKFRLL